MVIYWGPLLLVALTLSLPRLPALEAPLASNLCAFALRYGKVFIFMCPIPVWGVVIMSPIVGIGSLRVFHCGSRCDCVNVRRVSAGTLPSCVTTPKWVVLCLCFYGLLGNLDEEQTPS
ncbi:hypothetical protein SUGI_0851620 [Cryptomeria japonica]|nr:hypothetical protein SUGI_0851620 [Cryptomeria japonica]